MSQLVFKFPFKTKYYEQDYYVSSNNFAAYRLIESWPNWPDKWVNIYGPKGCGKTHLSNILKKKINVVEIFDANKIDEEIIQQVAFDREIVLQTNIVNVLKQKISTVNEIFESLQDYKHIPFRVEMNDIKKGIKTLIDKEFINETGEPETYAY